jgi:hypothetical protein
MGLTPLESSLIWYVNFSHPCRSIRVISLTPPCFCSTGENEPPSQLQVGDPSISFAIDGPVQSAMRKKTLPSVLSVQAMIISGQLPRAL